MFNLAKKVRKVVKIPSLSESIPDNIQYLLIGGGTASFSAFRAIKSADPTARVKYIFFFYLITPNMIYSDV